VPELFAASYGDLFDKGGIAVSGFNVNGETKTFRYADDYNILIEVAELDIAPLASVVLSFNFSLTLPKLNGAFGYSGDMAILSNPFPVLAGRISGETGGEWDTDSVPLFGDSYASTPANWRVSIAAPEGYTVAGSGSPETQNGAMNAYASRGFSFFVGKPSAQTSTFTEKLIISAFGTGKTPAIVEDTQDILSYYQSVFGDYPWQSLAVVLAEIPQDYITGSCFIILNSKLTDRTIPLAEAIAKLYFLELAGSDNLNQPWLSESISAFAAVMYMKNKSGEDKYQKYILDSIEPSFRLTIPSGILIGSPLWAFQSHAEIRVLLRERGLMMLYGLADAIGDDRMNDALQRYVSANAFGASYREDFIDAVKEASGADWSGYLTDYLDTNVGGAW
jgi:hypothetical protein